MTRIWRANEPPSLCHPFTASLPARWGRYLRRFVREEPRQALLVGVAMLAAAVLGGLRLDQTMNADEASTFVSYVRQPYWALVSLYDSANNHVLHSIVARAFVLLLGDQPWCLRLPAWIAGVACVPAAYAVGRVWAGRNAGLAAAVLVATWPYTVDLSANARGYSFVNFLTLSLLAFVPSLAREGTRSRWVAFGTVCALGMFTVPVFLFPLAGACLLLWWQAEEKGKTVRSLLATGSASAAVCAFLYLPVLLFTNPAMRMRLHHLADWEAAQPFFAEWRRLVLDGWRTWPFAYNEAWFVVPGLFILVGAWRVKALTAATGLGLALVGIATAPPPFWSVSYLWVIALVLFGIGLASAARILGRHAAIATSLALLGFAAWNTTTLLRSPDRTDLPWYIGHSDAPQAAALLVDRLAVEEAGVLGFNTGIRYYAHLLVRPDPSFRDNLEDLEGVDICYLVERTWPPHMGETTQRAYASLVEQGFSEVEATTFPASRVLRFVRTP